MRQRAALDVFHIEALLADQADDVGQLAGLVVDREQQRQAAAGGRGQRRGGVGAGDDKEAGGVVAVLVDALDEDLQPVELGCLRRGDGRQAFVTAFGHMAGGVGRVAPGARFQPVRFEERAGLRQRLLVADDGADARERRARQRQQVLADGQAGHAGDRELRARIEQIEHGRNVPGVGIFKRQNAVLRVPGFDRIADIGPGGVGFGAGKRQQQRQGDVAPRALHALIGGDVPPQQAALVRAGDRERLLQEAAVIRAQLPRHAGGVFGDERILPRGVKHRLAGGSLVLRHLHDGLHALREQSGHLRVDGVNLRAGLLELVHLRSSLHAHIYIQFYYTIKRSV